MEWNLAQLLFLNVRARSKMFLLGLKTCKDPPQLRNEDKADVEGSPPRVLASQPARLPPSSPAVQVTQESPVRLTDAILDDIEAAASQEWQKMKDRISQAEDPAKGAKDRLLQKVSQCIRKVHPSHEVTLENLQRTLLDADPNVRDKFFNQWSRRGHA